MATATGVIACADPGDEIIRHVIGQAIEESEGADRRQITFHVRILPEFRQQNSPLVSA